MCQKSRVKVDGYGEWAMLLSGWGAFRVWLVWVKPTLKYENGPHPTVEILSSVSMKQLYQFLKKSPFYIHLQVAERLCFINQIDERKKYISPFWRQYFKYKDFIKY